MTEASPSSSSGPATGHPLAVKIGVIVTAAFVVLDQATKELAEALLEPGEFVPWLGSAVGWQLIYNPGGAFGLPAPAWLFLVVTVVVLVLVARALPQATSLTSAVAFGMLLAGALGNALDRVLRPGNPDALFGGGYVVDFVAWGTFPRFNVADSAITVGFVLLVIALWAEERRDTEDAVADSGGSPTSDDAPAVGDAPASGDPPAAGDVPAAGDAYTPDDAPASGDAYTPDDAHAGDNDQRGSG